MNLITARNDVYLRSGVLGSIYQTSLARSLQFVLMFMLSTVLMLGSASLYAEDQSPAGAAPVVNINSADAATLAAQLNGVGQARAEEIVRYRETYGKFGSIEELAEVKGIGQSTLAKNRHLITLE